MLKNTFDEEIVVCSHGIKQYRRPKLRALCSPLCAEL